MKTLKNIILFAIAILLVNISGYIYFTEEININSWIKAITFGTMIWVACETYVYIQKTNNLSDTEKAMIAISYFTAYMNYKQYGIKPKYAPFTFEETNKEFKEIRKRVDEVLSQEN